MVTILPKEENGWAEAAQNFTKGLTEGYTTRADEMAIQKAIRDLPEGHSQRDLLNAVTNTKTYNPKSKDSAYKKQFEIGEFELKAKEYDEKKAERKAREDAAKLKADTKEAAIIAKAEEETAKQNRLNAEAQVLIDSSDLPEEKKKIYSEAAAKGELSPTSARSLSKPESEGMFEKESDKLAARRVDNYIQSTEEAAKAGQKDLLAFDLMDTIAEEGGVGFKVNNAVVDFLEEKGIKNIEAFRDPASKAYNSVSKILFSGFGDIVKGKVSNFEFSTFKGMLAQAEDSPQAAKAMIQAQRLVRNINIKENEIMQNIVTEYTSKNKSIPSNINTLVEERLRPIANEMTRETSARMKNILSPSSPSKNQKVADEIWNRTMGKKNG